MDTTRRNAVRVTSALLLLAGWSLAPPTAAADDPSGHVVVDERRIVLVDVPADYAALVGWAVGLFR